MMSAVSSMPGEGCMQASVTVGGRRCGHLVEVDGTEGRVALGHDGVHRFGVKS